MFANHSAGGAITCTHHASSSKDSLRCVHCYTVTLFCMCVDMVTRCFIIDLQLCVLADMWCSLLSIVVVAIVDCLR